MKLKKFFLGAICAAMFAQGGAPASASDASAAIENELLTGLLKESARVIKDAYGIDGRSGNKLSVIWDDDPLTQPLGSNALAAASGHFGFPYDTILVLNSEYFRAPAAASEAGLTALRLVVLHELTHGMQFTSSPGLITFVAEDPTKRNIAKGQFLYEGMAEYAAGGNDRTLGYVRKQRALQPSVTDDLIAKTILEKMTLAMSTVPGSGGFSPTDPAEMELFYIGSYLATRWFDTESKKNGGTGVKGLIAYLEANGSAQGENSHVFDAAIKTASNNHWNEYADFVNGTMNQQNDPTSGFYNFVLGVVREDASVDAGRVGGYYASGGSARTLGSLAKSLAGHPRDEAPLKEYGFVSTTIFGRVFQTEQTPPSSDPGDGSGGEIPAPAPGKHDVSVDRRGSSSNWSSESGGDLTVRVDVPFDKFTDVVSLDGAMLARDTATISRDFGAREGSTIVTIWEHALKKHVKKSGEHYVTIGFVDGVATHAITATVQGEEEPSAPAPDAPNGSASSGGGGCAAGAAAIAVCAMLAFARRGSR